MAQVDQSIATNSMQKAEKEFVTLNTQLAQLAALETHLSEEAYAAAGAEFRTLGVSMAVLVVLSIALSLTVTMLVRRAMLADIRAISDVVSRTGRRAAWPAPPAAMAATKSPTPRARSTTRSAP